MAPHGHIFADVLYRGSLTAKKIAPPSTACYVFGRVGFAATLTSRYDVVAPRGNVLAVLACMTRRGWTVRSTRTEGKKDLVDFTMWTPAATAIVGLLLCVLPASGWRSAVLPRLRPAPRRSSHMPAASRPRAMFSGIVEEMGVVESLAERTDMKLWDGTTGSGWELAVRGAKVLEGATDGCSIAVNGVCLTVVNFDPTLGLFIVGLAPETLRRTNLNPSSLKAGDPVNLERALPADGRNSGHFVQGHVDAVGELVSLTPDGDSLWVVVKAPSEVMKYIVPKGFIAVDGTSLTVCDVDYSANTFSFMLIGYTQQHVVIPKKSAGLTVNLEADVIGKYVERSLSGLESRVAALEAKLGQLGGAATA